CAWALGGMPFWAQCIIFSLSSISFLSCFVPVGDRYCLDAKSLTPGESFRLLMRFPGFWLALPFIAYALLQAFNPAWLLEYYDGQVYWLPIYSWADLPASVKAPATIQYTSRGAPFGGMNAFVELMVFSSGILTLWAVWLGLRSRRAIRFLYWVLCLQASAMGIFGMIQYWQRDPYHPKIYGMVRSANELYFGSFVYRNHGAVFLYLALGVALALFLYYWGRTMRRMERAGPHYLFLLLAGILCASLVVCASRGGIIAMVFLIACACLLGASYFAHALVSSKLWISLVVGVVLLGGALLFSYVADKQVLNQRMKEMVQSVHDPKSGFRYYLYESTVEMFHDHWLWGIGGGSYRYYSPSYMINYESFRHKDGPPRLRFRANYAHSDYLQFLAEYGVVGFACMALFFLYWLWKAFALRQHYNLLTGMILLTVFIMMLHAFLDFLYYSPAILIVVSVLVASSLKLAQCEKNRWNRLGGER
ncbi:MAG TPA: hypothetical protein DIU37_00750, partial [Opitutae bacterium]|nr:hypothetical protein [Opitutae bacterium]